jgi:phenylalanyl-tRNA synthetase beta chain
MIVSRQWLSEFVDLQGISHQELAEKLTRAACEVEAIEPKNLALNHVQIAQIQAVEPHPSSAKLSLVTLSCGTASHQVVCGATNFAVGNYVPFAPLGTPFAGGLVLETKVIGGIPSSGMLCSQQELGISDDHSGLWILDAEFGDSKPELGANLATALHLYSDTLFHIDNKSITNRGDLWGMLGMAREVAAIVQRPFNNPYAAAWQKSMQAKLPQTTEQLCKGQVSTPLALSYALLQIDGVNGTQQSPLTMRYRPSMPLSTSPTT